MVSQQVLFTLILSMMMHISMLQNPSEVDIFKFIQEASMPQDSRVMSQGELAVSKEELALSQEEQAVSQDNRVISTEIKAESEEAPETVFTEVFRAEPVDEKTRLIITGSSWDEGCPVPIIDLRLITVTCVDFDQKPYLGQMILHKNLADEVLEIFQEIYDARFPIQRMRLIDEYGADDTLSMEDNNTSAFNYRLVEGSANLSKHAYGYALDINPVQNPYILRGRDYVSPGEGRAYTDRTDIRPGMITDGDVVHRAFKSRGWTWGGDWINTIDYQHFQKTPN